jgi:DNA-binding response OmpR family regulator
MPMTILIVDDEPQLLKLLSRVFEREGYRVLTADRSDSAIELCAREAGAIDVMVLDVIIPPGGAEAILEAVNPEENDIRLVLVSGDQPKQELLDRSGGLFVRKPFLPKALARKIGALCEGRAGGAS